MAEGRRLSLVALAVAAGLPWVWPGVAVAAPAKIIDEDVTATAETSYGPLASWGFAPAWVELKNNEPRPRRVELTFKTHARGAGAHRIVLLDPNETRVVSLPIPSSAYGGQLEVKTPKSTASHPVTLRSSDVPRILVVGSGSALIAAAGFGHEKNPDDNFSPADHAQATLFDTGRRALPDLVAGYVGQTVVVLLDAGLSELTPGQRDALDAWVLTGGQLVYGPVPLSEGVPASLRIGEAARSGRSVLHGFGRVFAYSDEASLAAALRPLMARGNEDTGVALDDEGAEVVEPVPEDGTPYETPTTDDPPPTRTDAPVARTRAPADDSGANLLEGIGRPPIAAFVLIILLYVLLVGPGSLFVAHKWGRMWVLVSVPLTAFATCTGIGAYGIASDGLTTVHHASATATLLDPALKRSVTVGTRALYAALSPSTLRESGQATILPQGEAFNGTGWVADWTDGATFRGDLVPARTYRVLPFVAVQPSVSRLVATGDASAPSVENALGGKLRHVTVKLDGKLWEAHEVAAGARTPLGIRATPWGDDAELDLTLLPGYVSTGITNRLVEPLKEGEFLAILDDWSEVPTAGLDVTGHPSHHLVRGRVVR